MLLKNFNYRLLFIKKSLIDSYMKKIFYHNGYETDINIVNIVKQRIRSFKI
jgi:Zn/Cd-binding protein ZinT